MHGPSHVATLVVGATAPQLDDKAEQSALRHVHPIRRRPTLLADSGTGRLPMIFDVCLSCSCSVLAQFLGRLRRIGLTTCSLFCVRATVARLLTCTALCTRHASRQLRASRLFVCSSLSRRMSTALQCACTPSKRRLLEHAQHTRCCPRPCYDRAWHAHASCADCVATGAAQQRIRSGQRRSPQRVFTASLRSSSCCSRAAPTRPWAWVATRRRRSTAMSTVSYALGA